MSFDVSTKSKSEIVYENLEKIRENNARWRGKCIEIINKDSKNRKWATIVCLSGFVGLIYSYTIFIEAAVSSNIRQLITNGYYDQLPPFMPVILLSLSGIGLGLVSMIATGKYLETNPSNHLTTADGALEAIEDILKADHGKYLDEEMVRFGIVSEALYSEYNQLSKNYSLIQTSEQEKGEKAKQWHTNWDNFLVKLKADFPNPSKNLSDKR